MAATADIVNLLERALLPEGFHRLPADLPATKWWKHIQLPSDSNRQGALVITVIPGRRLGDFTIIPTLRLDTHALAPDVTPAIYRGSIHEWVLTQLGMYGTLLEIEDFYNREAP